MQRNRLSQTLSATVCLQLLRLWPLSHLFRRSGNTCKALFTRFPSALNAAYHAMRCSAVKTSLPTPSESRGDHDGARCTACDAFRLVIEPLDERAGVRVG